MFHKLLHGESYVLPYASFSQHNIRVQKYQCTATAHLYHFISGQCKKAAYGYAENDNG